MAQIITKPQVTATGQTTWKCSEPMVRPFLSVQLLILPVLASFYGGSRQVFHAMHGASSTSTMHACDWTRDARWAMEPTALDVMLVSAGHHQPARPERQADHAVVSAACTWKRWVARGGRETRDSWG
jgi:hypothetical protein